MVALDRDALAASGNKPHGRCRAVALATEVKSSLFRVSPGMRMLTGIPFDNKPPKADSAASAGFERWRRKKLMGMGSKRRRQE